MSQEPIKPLDPDTKAREAEYPRSDEAADVHTHWEGLRRATWAALVGLVSLVTLYTIEALIIGAIAPDNRLFSVVTNSARKTFIPPEIQLVPALVPPILVAGYACRLFARSWKPGLVLASLVFLLLNGWKAPAIASGAFVPTGKDFLWSSLTYAGLAIGFALGGAIARPKRKPRL